MEFSIFFMVVLSKLHKSKSSVVSVSTKWPVFSKMSAIFWRRVESFKATRRLYSWIKSDEGVRCPLLPFFRSFCRCFGLQDKQKKNWNQGQFDNHRALTTVDQVSKIPRSWNFLYLVWINVSVNHCVSQACPGLNHFLWSQRHYSPLQLLFGLIMHHTHTHSLFYSN